MGCSAEKGKQRKGEKQETRMRLGISIKERREESREMRSEEWVEFDKVFGIINSEMRP